MQPQSLDRRVEGLETRVTTLEQLPARIDAIEGQIVQLRTHMDGQFSTVFERFDGIDRRLDSMDARFGGIDRRLDSMDARFDGIDARLDETNRRISVLHEDVNSRLVLIAEGRPRRKKRSG